MIVVTVVGQRVLIALLCCGVIAAATGTQWGKIACVVSLIAGFVFAMFNRQSKTHTWENHD